MTKTKTEQIELKPVTCEDFDEVIGLRVAQNQTGFVAANVESIAQAYVQPGCFPRAIYAGGVPVGFAMWCIDPDDGEWWLYRLMVDERYQGRGHGKAAMRLVLETVKPQAPTRRMLLGVEPENEAAIALYKSLGFAFNGQTGGREHIMELRW